MGTHETVTFYVFVTNPTNSVIYDPLPNHMLYTSRWALMIANFKNSSLSWLFIFTCSARQVNEEIIKPYPE